MDYGTSAFRLNFDFSVSQDVAVGELWFHKVSLRGNSCGLVRREGMFFVGEEYLKLVCFCCLFGLQYVFQCRVNVCRCFCMG